MKAYLFRSLPGEMTNRFTQEVGLVMAENLHELFWHLDEFGNPYAYEYCEALPGDALLTFQCKVEDEPVQGESQEGGDDEFYCHAQPAADQQEFTTISESLASSQHCRIWQRFTHHPAQIRSSKHEQE